MSSHAACKQPAVSGDKTIRKRFFSAIAMSDNEVEEVSFLPGDTILNKKAVYEPSGTQRCRQLVCSRSWAITILILMGLFLVLIAVIASFARQQPVPCNNVDTVTQPVTTAPPVQENYIATNGKDFPWHDIRLPKDIVPDSYDIHMHPNISQSFFKGTVKIQAIVVSSTDFIVLHIKDVNITHFAVNSLTSGDLIRVSESLEYTKNEQFYMKLDRSVHPKEEIEIVVKFEGKLTSKLAGFYKSSYKLSSGESRDIATTHFEPTDARAAFPCFDEPELKANFTLSIVREKNHISLFNMPLKETKKYQYDDVLYEDIYETSVKMSTYLVAFVVCDFASISNTTSDGIKVSVYAPHEQIDQAKFALEAAVVALQYYNSFFGVKYPLPKQDLIAIPDFAAGAMENWGLITYRMSAILYDEEESSLGNKQWVATVIAHELAHQWFGNLVTMEWWDDLWLNEGFASYVEYIGANVISPEFHMNEQFVTSHLQRAMYLDSLSNSHPIHVRVTNPDQINEIFDQISYSKGGSVLRMLRNILGETNFHNGLTNYLTVHKYGNAKTDDLWSALKAKNGQDIDIKALMDTWTKQMGFPVVQVTQNGNSLSLTQERFVLNPANVNDAVPASSFNYKWYIPLTFVTSADTETNQLIWMNMSSAETVVPPGVKWIKANAGMFGYYRVNYDEANWQALIKQLEENHKVFTAADRAGLIDDAFNLARAGLISQKIALDLTLYLKKEEDYVPWKSALDNLAYIEKRLINKEVYTNFKNYVLDLIDERLQALGWHDEGSHLERFLRGEVLTWAVKLGHKLSVEKGLENFKKWTQDHSSISPNMKNIVYRTGVEYGDEDNWKACWKVYVESNVPSEKQKMLVAMAFTKNTRLLNLYLSSSLNKSKIRSQDTDSVVSSVAANPSGQLLAWRFFQENWDTFSDRYSMGSFSISRLIKGVSHNFDTQFAYDEVREFFSKRETHSGARSVKQSLEQIQMNIDWLGKHETEVTEWLNKYETN